MFVSLHTSTQIVNTILFLSDLYYSPVFLSLLVLQCLYN